LFPFVIVRDGNFIGKIFSAKTRTRDQNGAWMTENMGLLTFLMLKMAQ